MTGPSGGPVTSPNYPSNYDNNEIVRWLIIVPEGSIIRLTFARFYTGGSDFLTIYDGTSDDATELRRLSGYHQEISPIISTSNTMLLRFTPKGRYTSQGFQFSYISRTADECWDPGVPLNGIRDNNSNFTSGQTVRYTCMAGYHLWGTANITCQPNGTWSDDTPSCEVESIMTGPSGGPVRSPDYYSYYDNNVNARWLIIVPEGSIIRLTFVFVEIFMDSGFLTIYDGTGDDATELRRFSGYHRQISPIISTSNTMLLRFTPYTWFWFSYISRTPDECWDPGVPSNGTRDNNNNFTSGQTVRYTCMDGYHLWGTANITCQANGTWSDATPTCEVGSIMTGPFRGPVTSPDFPRNYDNNENVRWLITVPEESIIRLTFDSFDTQYDDILTIYDGASHNATVIRRLSGYHQQISPIISTSNVMLLRFTSNYYYTRQGFQFYYTSRTADECWDPGVPANGARDNNINFTSGQTVRYTCMAGYHQWGTANITCQSNWTWSDATPTCEVGSIMTEPSGGPVTSPNYPSDYDNNENVRWLITVPEGSIIHLTFGSFATQRFDDILTIYDGASHNATELRRLSGYHQEISPIISTSNVMLLRFTSDYYYTFPGFQFSYTSRTTDQCWDPGVPTNGKRDNNSNFTSGQTVRYTCMAGYHLFGTADITCQSNGTWSDATPTCEVTSAKGSPVNTSVTGRGINVTGSSGGPLTSPNFPSNYGNNENYQWSITVPEASIIRLAFDSFDTEEGFDFFTIYDGTSDNAAELQRLTGDSWPISPIISTSNTMLLRFTSDYSVTRQGFNFSYISSTAGQCWDPGVPTNGIRDNNSNFTSGQTVRYTCMAGYQLLGTANITCQPNGTWSDATPTCEVLTPPDNRGTEFVVGFLQNYEDGELDLLLTGASSEPAIVTIIAPGASYIEQLVVTDAAVQVVTLPNSTMLRGHERAQKGVLVTADREIILYGVNKGSYASDGFLGLPVDVLGKEFFVVSYTPASGEWPSEFAIFGVKNDTLINVTVKGTVYHDDKYYNAGSVITFSLDRLEAIQFQGWNLSDLTGTHIVSDKPVSVMSGVRCTNVPNHYYWCDHLVEHIPPVNTWGRRFVTVPLAGRQEGNTFRLVAARNGTTVNVTGVSPRTLASGEFWELDFSSSTYKSITSSQPIMVLQYSKALRWNYFGKGSFMMYLPSVEQFAADYTFTTVDTWDSPYLSYVNIVIKTSETSGLTYDGNPLHSNTIWSPIPDSDLSATQLYIGTKGTHKIKHESANVFFSLTYYGFSYEVYVGFPLGLRLTNLPGGCDVTEPIVGDGIDNDCDQLVDEEQLNGIDDDSDGLIDEDLTDTTETTTLVNATTESTTSFNTAGDLATTVFNTTTPTEPTTATLLINVTTTQLSRSPDASGTMATTAVADCGCPLLPSHTEVSLTATTTGSVATYRCKTGFQSANGTTTLTCGSDGEWKGTLLTCEAIIPCIRFCGFGSCFVDGDIQKCDCNTGYGFFGLSQFCLDINECEDGLDYCLGRPACVPNARCINSPYGSYTCRCPSGYTGDGRTSCEDEDECLLAPCSEFANCTNTAGSYTCQCLDGYVGSGTVCTEINECSSSPCIGGTCVDRINGYTCTCREGFAGERCETNVNDCEPPPCLNNGTCSDRINTYSCDCVDGWEGMNCEEDMNECTSDPCHRHADCGNTNGSFICTCKQGFHEDGFECTETDECASDPCQNGGTCIDGLNKYSCVCPSEWQGVNCERDVDECLIEKCHQNSACNNSPGSYSCTCREGFYGNGLTQENLVCRETILFPYGEEQGDMLLPDTDDHKDISLPSLIDISIGFPFFGQFYYSLYFSDNGLIIFPPTAQSRARREPYPNPSLFRRNQTVQAGFPPMVAASWGDVDLTTDVGKVWYQVYSDDNSVDNATQTVFDMVTTRMYQSFSDTFLPTWVLVVTWDSVPSVEAMYTKQNPNTFQAVLATDGSDSVAFLTYKEDEMLWTNETQDVLLGYNSANGVNLENIRLADPYRPDQVNGNTGLKGRWAFKLESDATRKTNYKKLCRDWYKTEPDPSEWIVGKGLCPCTLLQALRDLRFAPVTLTLSPFDIWSLLLVNQDLEVCFSPLFASPTGSSVDCCYKFLALNTEIPLAGSHHRYQRFSQLHTDFDVNPKSWCCSLSDDEDFCNLYYEKRPPNSCSFYRPPRLAITWGDPHMKTLDGLAYTFNGLGEFTLVKTSGASVEFRLQGRTEKAIANGTQEVAEATVFTAFASKQNGSSTVEMGMNKDRTNMTLIVDKRSINITDLRQNGAQRFANLTLQYNFNSNQTSVVASFSSGITVTVTLQKFMLNVQFGAPDSFENTTRGMLGVWNDNILDDFTYPNGTVLQAPEDRNLTEEEIFPWGLSWQIRQDDSLFTYEDGQNATSFAKPDFRPKFLNQLLAAVSPDKRSKAEVLCGTNVECLFDFLSTNDAEVGEQTRSSIVTFDSDAETLANFPPNITTNATVNGIVGQQVELQVIAVDPEDNPLRYSIGNVNNIPGATINPVNGILRWTPRNILPVQLEIIAQDNKGASSSTYPMVKLCNCQHGGICNFVTVDFTGDINPVGQFQVVSCSCPEAWTGEFCETDKNECEEDPCYPGAACTDMVAPEHGFECGPCPNGLDGTGEKCYDINECVQGQQCEQPHNCVNILGSYTCGCDLGYTLDSNGLNCTDINECDISTADCAVEATCTNTEGSFTCTCTTGYTGNGTYCADADECTTSASCDRNAVCDNTVGSYTCTCKAGYEGSGRRCEDKDECVDPDICHTNARCTNSIGSYSCSCNSGYRRKGAVCTNVDECEELLDNCSPGQGICTDNPGSYSCACRGGYEGDGITCQDVDECSDAALNSCTENADCTNTEGSYNCLCTDGYEGIGTVICTDVNECGSSIDNCAHEATCTNSPGSYTCSCNAGFVGNGIQCEDIDECVRGEADCDIDTKAVCTNLIGGYNCTCYNGYEGDGRHCTDVNECMTDNGKCSMNCFNTDGSYTCSCEDGYRLAVDGFKCDDIDECAEQLDDCEQACTNTDGGFNCSCVPGFIQVGDSCKASETCTRTVCTNADCFVKNGIERCLCFSGYNITNNATVCTDIDECSSDTLNACDQLCNNTNGGYTCGCDSDYMIGTDGRQCTDIDECSESSLNDCDPNAFCNNNQGGYTCSCRQGYVGNGTSCADNDECTFGSRIVNCSANAQCFNFNGGFNCTCRDGYTGDGFFCADVDECTGDLAHCHEQAVCTNVLGSFECACKDGYNGTGTVCEDIDECEDEISQCDENATCTNTAGSYTCTCDDGYIGTGRTCTDLDECLSGQNNCHEQASCRNTEGSYVCSCNTGFTGIGTSCEDEDECREGTDTCTVNSVCTNTVGSFTCPCKPGYFGSNCVDVHECEDGIDNCHDHADCTNTPGSYSCTCHSGYFGDGTVCTAVTTENTRTPTTTTPTSMTVTPEPPKPRKFVPAQITMEREFRTEYNDKTSEEYMELSSQLKTLLSVIYTGIPGFIEIIIIQLVEGSVKARYAAVFAVEESQPDSIIQDMAKTNLQQAITSGRFDPALQVTSSNSLQPIVLTEEELEQVVGGFCQDVQCGEGGVCSRNEPYPGAVIAECQCQENYCNTGTCEYNVQEGPKCTCPAVEGSWYGGERCQIRLTQADVIGIAAGCLCALLVVALLVAVCMAKRSRHSAKMRITSPPVTLPNYHTASESWQPFRGLPITDLSEDQDDYLSPESLGTRGGPFFNPSVENIPTGELKIPRPSVMKPVSPKHDEDEGCFQTFEFKF
ncbi:uncharacterized protein LOC144908255 isoform X2 [Branchiostoma floridae x Branchiostoma belcheri]